MLRDGLSPCRAGQNVAFSRQSRAEAEEEALDSLEDYFDDVDCPEECPMAVRATDAAGDKVVNYSTTNSPITGSNGFGYIRYDGSGTSTASTTYQCQVES